jgi:hypothetical protein
MAGARYRPNRLPYDKQTYNLTFPVDMLDEVKRVAKEQEISTPEYVRMAVQAYLGGSPPPQPQINEPAPGGFEDGVKAACLKIARNSRLHTRMATGITMGEDIANRILKDLLG